MTDLRERLQSGLTDRYLPERELGHGGVATVFLARDLRHDRLVALKVMHPDLAARLGPERFQREIRTAARLQHPHILGVHDSGEAAGRLWFTMPYVEGESLRDRLRRERQLPLEDALRISREAAERCFRRALALDPNGANTFHWYGSDYLTAVGRVDEAVEAERRARNLDPLSPTINASLGWTLYRARRYREARTHLEAAHSMEPNFSIANLFLSEVHLIEGRYADAVRVMEGAVHPKERSSMDFGILGYAYAKAGRRRDAERLLHELEDRGARGYVSSTGVAVLLTGLGDTVQAFRRLERAADQHDPFLVYHFVNDPLLDGLRNTPRGKALLRRMGLASSDPSPS